MLVPHPLSLVALVTYAAAVTVLAAYAAHSLWLLGTFYRHRRAAAAVAADEVTLPLPAELPVVLVQLPVFNERDVVERVVAAAGRLRWPRSRLRIQLLDDSTDDATDLGARAVAALAAAGLDAVMLHRTDRTGYKAGALDAGLRHDAARPDGAAPFVAIFDADFVPPVDFLERAIRPFLRDPGLGLVQGRWEHLNRDHNALTRTQAVGIDAHFAIEQGARAWAGLPMNFNGTCGMWRVAAIHAAGGWEHDTLTEDMDLSYRAQLAGWRCTYRLDLAVPGELPTTVAAWRAQQFRWAKGSIQTAKKLLPRVWRSRWSLRERIAATFHTTHYLVHPLILVNLLAAPLALPVLRTQPPAVLMLGAMLFAIGVATPLALYAASQVALRGRRASRYLRDYPSIAAIGSGVAISNTRAIWQALRGRTSAFVRTPKQGDHAHSSYRAGASRGGWELLAGGWAVLGAALAALGSHPWVGAVLVVYATGFVWMGLRLRAEARGPTPVDATPPSAGLAWVIGLGAPLVVGMTALGALGARAGGWRERPVAMTAIGLALGAVYLVATHVIPRRPIGRRGMIGLGAIAVAMRVAALPMAASDDVNRYVVEGTQVSVGENPYAIPPVASAAARTLPRDLQAGVNHPTWTAIYPPATLALEAAVVRVRPSPVAFKIVMLGAELVGLLLVAGLLGRVRAAPPSIVIAAWCPLGPIWGAGEGHHDMAMAALLVAALMASAARPAAGLVLATVASLVKPFAAVGAVAVGLRARGRHWLLAGALALGLYLPFVGAGWGLFRSLGRFGTEKHFHGVLEPAVRTMIAMATDAGAAARATPVVLAGLWLTATAVIVVVARRRGAAPAPTALALLAVLLVCAPTLHPWYLTPLALLAPLTRSWALRVWLATAPVYWLHARAFGDAGWAEVGWVTTVAHVPAALVLAIELVRTRARPAATTNRDLVDGPGPAEEVRA